jgi:hypothetical protein
LDFLDFEKHSSEVVESPGLPDGVRVGTREGRLESSLSHFPEDF